MSSGGSYSDRSDSKEFVIELTKKQNGLPEQFAQIVGADSIDSIQVETYERKPVVGSKFGMNHTISGQNGKGENFKVVLYEPVPESGNPMSLSLVTSNDS